MNIHVLTVNKRRTNGRDGDDNDEEKVNDGNIVVGRRQTINDSPINGFGGVSSCSALPVSSQQRHDTATPPASVTNKSHNHSHNHNHVYSHSHIIYKNRKKMRHPISTSMTTAHRAVSSPLNIDKVLSQALKTKTLLRRKGPVVPPYMGSSSRNAMDQHQTDGGCADDFKGRCNDEPTNSTIETTTTKEHPFHVPFTLQALPIASAHSDPSDCIMMKEPEVLVTTTAATTNIFLNNETKWRPFFTFDDIDKDKNKCQAATRYTSIGGDGRRGRRRDGDCDMDGSQSWQSNDTIETTSDIWFWDGTSTIIDYGSYVDGIIHDDGERSNGGVAGDKNEIWSDRPVTGFSAVQNSNDYHQHPHQHQKEQMSLSVIPKEILRRELPNIKTKTILPTIKEEISSSVKISKDADDISGDDSDSIRTRDLDRDRDKYVIDPSAPTSFVPPPTTTTETTTTTENDDRIARRFLRRRRSVERFWEYLGCLEKLERLSEVCHPDFVADFRGPQKQFIGQMSMGEVADWMRGAFSCSPDFKFFYSHIDQSANDPNMLVLHDFCANGTHTGTPFCKDGLPPLEARGHKWVMDECETYFYFGDDGDDDDDDDGGCPKILSFEEIAFGEYTGPFKLYHLIKKKHDEEDLERRRNGFMQFAIQRHQI